VIDWVFERLLHGAKPESRLKKREINKSFLQKDYLIIVS